MKNFYPPLLTGTSNTKFYYPPIVAPPSADDTATYVLVTPDPTLKNSKVAQPGVGITLAVIGGQLFISSTGSAGGGTVSSIGLAMPTEFTVSSSPITTSGTITVTKNNQTGNKVYAAPADGTTGQPTFRLVSANDIAGLFTAGSNISIVGGSTLTISATGLPTGTVTSVGLSLPPSLYTISGSPVTGSGTLTGTLINQASGQFWGSPPSSTGTPYFRYIVGSDLALALQAGANITFTPGASSTTISGNAGTLTSFSATGLTPWFTTSVSNSTTTPGLTFNATGAKGDIPYYSNTNTAANLGIGSTNQVLGVSSGLPAYFSLLQGPGIQIIYGANSVTFSDYASAALLNAGNCSPLFTTSIPNGTLNFTLINQASGGLVYAGPVSGPPAPPTFRTLALSDLPTGVVTSVALSLPNIFNVSGSPVTGAGTLTGTLANQASGLAFMGPISGNSTTPTFRAITLTDLPVGVYTVNSSTLLNNLASSSGSGILVQSGNLIFNRTILGTSNQIGVANGDGTGGNITISLVNNTAIPGSPTTTTQPPLTSNTTLSTTAYTDAAVAAGIAGVNPAISVTVATTQASDTSSLTYNNGVGGIGATLTGAVNTALTIDGVTFNSLNQSVLVKNDTQSPSGAFDGIYNVTQLQTGVLPPILTRRGDYNQPSDINNSGAIPVISGTANAGTSWYLTTRVTTVGTDPLTYSQLTINPSKIQTTTLTNTHIWVGNSSNLAVDVPLSQDATLANNGALTISTNVVSNSKFRQSAAISVVANATNATANVADLSATAGSQVLTSNAAGTALIFRNIASGDFGANLLDYTHGGTGLSGTPSNGQLLIGNGAGYTLNTLSQGVNITIVNSAGGITISAAGSGNVGTVTSGNLSPWFNVSIANPVTAPAITFNPTGAKGDIPYYSNTNTAANLAIGQQTQLLGVTSGGIPGYFSTLNGFASATVSTNLSITSNSYQAVDASQANVTLTLAAASSMVGKVFWFKNITVTGSNTAIFTTNGTDVIEIAGAFSKTVAKLQIIGIMSDGISTFRYLKPQIESPQSGGTGSSTIPTDGQIPIGSTSGQTYSPANITAIGLTVVNSANSITLLNYASAGGGSGTVTSVSAQPSSIYSVVNSTTAAVITENNSGYAGGRLTLISGNPTPTFDILTANASSIYFAPYGPNSNVISLNNGSTTWTPTTFSELSTSVPSVAYRLYDVFIYNSGTTASPIAAIDLTPWDSAGQSTGTISTIASSTTPTVVTSNSHGLSVGVFIFIDGIVGTIGTNATTGLNGKCFRISAVTTNTFSLEGQDTSNLGYTSGGTWYVVPQSRTLGVSLLNGVYVKSADTTRRLVGTFMTRTSGQTEDSNSRRLLFNISNKLLRVLKAQDNSVASWTCSVNTTRPANNNTTSGSGGSRVELVNGILAEIANFRNYQLVSGVAGTYYYTIGFGLNSNVVKTVDALNGSGGSSSGNGVAQYITTEVSFYPNPGYNWIQRVELSGNNAVNATVFGQTTGAGITTIQNGLIGLFHN